MGSQRKSNFKPYGKKRSGGPKKGAFESAVNDRFKPAKRQTKKTHGDGLKRARNPKRR